ncbi:hypothetical protein Q7P35_010392 [Cladosporium inversicolor]
MPYIARDKEATLTALETNFHHLLKNHESYQKNIMHTTPEHTSTSMRLRKSILVPFSRHRVTNGFLRRVGLLERVQKARVALLYDDFARCLRIEREWRLWYVMWELRWLAENGGGSFYFEIGGYRL